MHATGGLSLWSFAGPHPRKNEIGDRPADLNHGFARIVSEPGGKEDLPLPKPGEQGFEP